MSDSQHERQTSELKHDELPLPDYDHLPLGTLPMRITPLDEAALMQLMNYELAHANRLPVTVVLQARLEELRRGEEPHGTVADEMPEITENENASGSQASPATSGPPINPPFHGTPVHPGYPRG
ncbi:MAG: hypothetical protein JWP30_824 [Homoserinimonas sp.]|nr:hypothetical protein [Homoserinimonas sp.]